MSEKIKTAVMEVIKAHMDGEDKNTKAVLSDIIESVNELETLEQEPTYYPPCQVCNKKMDEIRRIYDKIKEQEPCDNAISRSDMLDAIGHGTTYTSEELQRVIQNLPPVNPQPLEGFIDGIHAMGYREGYKDAQKQKSGEWFIDERPESDREVICSNCDQPIFKYHKLDFDYRPKYCPNCGAKMESEDKE